MKHIHFFLGLFTLAALSTSLVSAQEITWTNITAETNLPDGAELYKGERENPALQAWYLDIDLSVAEISLIPYLSESGTETISHFSGRKNSFAAINGGYFGSGSSFSTLVQPGEVLAQNVKTVTRNGMSYPLIRSAFTIGEDRSMSVDWVYHFGSTPEDMYRFDEPLSYSSSADEPLPAPEREMGTQLENLFMSLGGGPVLVKGDSVHISYTEEIFWGSGVGRDNRDPRTAAGYTNDNRAILLVADGRQSGSEGLSLPELAQVMIDLGSTEAINLDGGGSSQMTVGTELVNRPSGGTFQREVATFLAVMPSDSIPQEQSAEFEKIIDSGDEGIEITEGWFESANDGFFGETPSLIIEGGEGTETVTFPAGLPEEGDYELYAWWVASFNRSPRTAVVVQHAGGRDTVRVDQSTNTARWNKVGTFNFTGTDEDKVIISNDGSNSNTFVVADAIRFLSVADDIGTSAENYLNEPQTARLHHAYPNPFNPATQIEFHLSEPGFVDLSVFDIAGRKIATVASGKFSTGLHSYQWDASQHSSGVYVARLSITSEQGSSQIFRKMTLLK